MTDTNKPRENTGNERTVHNPKAPGQAERVNPTNGESAGTVDTNNARKD
jgi:hypothetical protein